MVKRFLILLLIIFIIPTGLLARPQSVQAIDLQKTLQELKDKVINIYKQDPKDKEFLLESDYQGFKVFFGDKKSNGKHRIKVTKDKFSIDLSFKESTTSSTPDLKTEKNSTPSSKIINDTNSIISSLSAQIKSIEEEQASLSAKIESAKEDVESIDKIIQSTIPGTELGFDELSKSEMIVKNANVSKDLDIYYWKREEDLKEKIIIRDKNAPSKIVFSLKTEGLTPFDIGSGVIYFKDKDGKYRFRITKGYVKDLTGAFSNDVNTIIEDNKLTHTLDPIWLNDPERVYPLTIYFDIQDVEKLGRRIVPTPQTQKPMGGPQTIAEISPSPSPFIQTATPIPTVISSPTLTPSPKIITTSTSTSSPTITPTPSLTPSPSTIPTATPLASPTAKSSPSIEHTNLPLTFENKPPSPKPLPKKDVNNKIELRKTNLLGRLDQKKVRTTLSLTESRLKSFNINENPEFEIDLKDERFKKAKTDKITARIFHKEKEGIEYDAKVSLGSNKKLIVSPIVKNHISPGTYRVSLIIPTDKEDINIEQDFNWGVLAVNFNKTVYDLGETARLYFTVLTSTGETNCTDLLEAEITSPQGKITQLSVKEKSIILSNRCGEQTVEAPPDYLAEYQVTEKGTYQIKVTAIQDESYSIIDQFQADPNSLFSVERKGPTRIYPFDNIYPFEILITAKEDFAGKILETVPLSFEISNISDNGRVETNHDQKTITWEISLNKNETKTLKYSFLAPPVSPEFYLLGPLRLLGGGPERPKGVEWDSPEVADFEEIRSWQIAADPITNITCRWDGSTDSDWQTGDNWTCTSGSGPPSNTCSGNSGNCFWAEIEVGLNNPVLLNNTSITISGLNIAIRGATTSMTINGTGNLTVANIGTAPLSIFKKGSIHVGANGTLSLSPSGAATCLTTNTTAAVTAASASATITSSNSNCTWDHNTNFAITNAGAISGTWSMLLAGGFTNTGTLNMTGGTFTTDTNTPTITCSATRANNLMNNLTVNVNTTLAGSCKFGAAVTITTGDTLTTGTGTHESTTTGTAISNSGTFTASTGNTWIISGSGTVGSGSLTGTNDFVNLTIDGTNITANAGVSFDVSATLTIGTASDGNNDTFDIGSGLSVTSTSIGTVTLQTNGAGDTNSITGSGRLVITNSNLSANGTISSIVRFDGVSSSAVTVPARTYGSDVELYDAASTTQRNFNTGSGTVSITGNVYLIANSITAAGDVNFSSFTNGTVVTISGATGIDYTGTGAADELITLGSGTWTVAGSVDFTGGTLASTNGGTFDLSGTTKTLTSASQSFRDLKISGSVTAQDAVIASRELQVTGTFTLGANNLTVGLTSSTSPGYIKVPSGGTITQASGTTVIQNGASGTSCIGGNSDNSCTGTVGTIGFYNLDIGNASSATVTTINGTSPAITVDNVLTVTTSATLNAGSSTITLTGKGITPLVRNGTFTSSSSTVKYTGASGAPWWSTNYAYRKQITVSATDAVTSGYSTSLTFDHATLYSSSKSLISGDDVRIVYYNVSSTELDRVLDDSSSWNNAATKIWFKLQANISASSTDSNYYMYYNYPSAASPPVNKSNVYAFWDDFDNANYTDNWTAGTGTWTEGTTCGGPANCVYVSSGTSGDLYTTSFTLDNGEWSTSMKRTSSFAARLDAESYIVNTSNFAAVSLHGNGSLYQSLNRSGSNLLTNPCTSWTADTSYHTIVIKKRTNYWSWSMDGTTKCTETPTFTPLNTSLEVGGDGTPYYDWVKARKLVATEPSTSLGTEASQTTTLTSTTITFYNLTINGSGVTFNLGAATTVSNDLTITAGTLDVTTTNHALNVAHDWSNSGSFTARNGTVTLNGAGGSTQTITGSTTFYALAATATTARTLAFQATATQTITFSLNFSGASAQLLTLQRRAADASGQWNINTTGIASPTLNYLSVSNSNSTLCIVATNSTNGGGNTNWDFTGGGCGGGAPTAPTVLYLHETNAQSGDANPIKVSKSTFVHSSVYNDPDTGDVANKYQIIVYSNSGCTTVVWNSGDSGTSMTNCTEPNRCADITFGGSALFFNGIKYYWKMKYWDDTPTEGVFSGCTDNFTMLGPNDQMRHGNFSTRSGAKGKFVW